MDAELEQLAALGARVIADALKSANRDTARSRLAEFYRGSLPSSATRLGTSEGAWADYLRSALSQDPAVAAELRGIIDEFGGQPSVHNTVSGGTAEHVIQTGSIGSLTIHHPPAAGDHVDFGGSTFYGPVVGAQHYHGPQQSGGGLPDPGSWPRIADVDPVTLGVRPARHRHGEPELPSYVARDADRDFDGLSAQSGPIVITGGRLSGKTRTAWEFLARSAHPTDRIHAPAPGADLRRLPGLLRDRDGSYVLWLDELDGHLGEHGLDAGLVAELIAVRVPIVATMRDEAYDRHRFGSGPASRVLRRAVTVELPPRWNETELERLAQAAPDDPRLADALTWRGDHSVPEYLAVGPELWDYWRRAARPGGPHPRGHLLVRAAIDLARCGVTGDIPVALLEEASRSYGPETAEAERESAEEAFAWATERRHGVTGLLVRGAQRVAEKEAETWRAYGSLVADAMRDASLPPVPSALWHCAIEETRHDGETHDRVRSAAHAVFAPKAEDGDAEAMRMMGILCEADGDEDASLDWFRKAVLAGKTDLSGLVGETLLARGEAAQALPYLEAAVERNPHGYEVRLLGQAHRALAEHWLRTAAERGDRQAMYDLGVLLHGSGSGEDALRWYVRAAEAGHERAAKQAGDVLYAWDDRSEAKAWYRFGVALGDPDAMNALATLLEDVAGEEQEAQELYRAAVEAGVPLASANLGTFLIGRGAVEEGMALLRRAADEGHGEAAYRLAGCLDQQGGSDEAEKWYRKAAAEGHYHARKHLAERMTGRPTPPDTVEE
ncbi:tetratricopeptide repeat protein [Streptomyces sp. TP-A0356]|uniref:tetratricopeptide repeat protein n=1 Tax=Streptomyces sp. TP-A0356 TaxID=1359208 RepID=UPI0006E2705B|nr:tetratricopeptide repeat protein [Streptomyces sp. TP-A0356]